MNQMFEVGTVVGTHGLRGDLKVRTETPNSEVLLDASEVQLCCTDGRRLTADVAKASVHKQMILLKLKGYEHVNKVQELVGAKVFMALDELPDLDDDTLYWHQLEGLQVVDQATGALGVLTSIMETAGHDLYVVRGPQGEVMFPAVEAFIEEIDLEQRVMRVKLPEGLIEING